jgi:hypothetical protein
MRRTDAVVAVGVLLEEREVLVGSDHWPRIAGQGDYREGSEDGVDCTPFQPESAQVRAGEKRTRGLEQLGRPWLAPVGGFAVPGLWRRG